METEIKCTDCQDTGLLITDGHVYYCGCVKGLMRFEQDRQELAKMDFADMLKGRGYD